jgi:hypothetical protein
MMPSSRPELDQTQKNTYKDFKNTVYFLWLYGSGICLGNAMFKIPGDIKI